MREEETGLKGKLEFARMESGDISVSVSLALIGTLITGKWYADLLTTLQQVKSWQAVAMWLCMINFLQTLCICNLTILELILLFSGVLIAGTPNNVTETTRHSTYACSGSEANLTECTQTEYSFVCSRIGEVICQGLY